jgi:hypothetical protein
MFNMASQGLSFKEIRDRLSESGYAAPYDHLRINNGRCITQPRQWTVKGVRAVLQNVQYTGAYVSGRIIKNYETGRMYHTSKKDWVIIPGKRPPIVSEELFGDVQAIIANSRKRRKANASLSGYLLKGKLFCGCCGYALRYDNSHENTCFRCIHSLADPSAECSKMKISAPKLDDTVLTAVKERAEGLVMAGDSSLRIQTGAYGWQISECRQQLQRYMELRQKYYEQYVTHEIDRDMYMKMKSECGSGIDRLNNQLALLTQDERDRQAAQRLISVAQDVLSVSASARANVDALVEKVLVFPGGRIDIRWL